MNRTLDRSRLWLRQIALVLALLAVFTADAVWPAWSGPVNPPFLPTFGTGVPGGTVPTNQLYFDTTPTPFQGYVYDRTTATWEQYGGGGGGGGCVGAAGSILISSTGTNCIGDAVLSDGAGNWSNLITITWIANRFDDPGDITFTGTANIRANGLNIGGGTGSVDIGTDGGTGHDVNLTGWDIAITGGNSTTIGTAATPLIVNGQPSLDDPTDWTAALQACTATIKGMVPTPPNDASKYLDGTCHFTVPSGGGGGPDLFAPPLAATFSAFSTDATMPTLADQSYGMVISIGASSALSQFRGALQTLPAPPYVAIARLRQSITPFFFRNCGLLLGDGGTHIEAFSFQPGGGASAGWAITQFNGTTFSGFLVAPTGGQSIDEYLEITDDGTTRAFLLSADGRNWAVVGQETHTNFLTPTTLSAGCGTTVTAGPTAGTDNLFLDILYWSVT